MHDLISNMFSIIRNGLINRRKTVIIPFKTYCLQVLKVLYREGFLNGFCILSGGKIKIFLKYSNGNPVFSKINLVSKPSRKIYISSENLWKVRTAVQLIILSTPLGILTDKESRKYFVGGEVLCILK